MENMNGGDLDSTNYEEQKSKKRSFVWNFFDKISRERVQCRLCKHEQNYQGTTGNILRHLKARHRLDATIRGQQDPENQALIKELMMMISTGTTAINIDQKPITIRKTSVTSDSSDTVDPYNDNDDEINDKGNNANENKEMSFENSNVLCEELQDCTYNNYLKVDDQKSTKKTKLEEDRILAETEYYREKAAYFRFQKHLTALQAKKVKLEIDQILLNNKSET